MTICLGRAPRNEFSASTTNPQIDLLTSSRSHRHLGFPTATPTSTLPLMPRVVALSRHFNVAQLTNPHPNFIPTSPQPHHFTTSKLQTSSSTSPQHLTSDYT